MWIIKVQFNRLFIFNNGIVLGEIWGRTFNPKLKNLTV